MDLKRENPVDEPEPSPNLRLDSWKEIASYLNRDIRTTQLWEKKEGLPVHRHAHGARASVYAFTSEIDTWQKSRRTQREETPGPSAEISVALGFDLADKARHIRRIYVGGMILAFAVIAGGLAYWRQAGHQKRVFYEHATIAVLPFEDLSGGPIEEYLADGLTDELITNLGRSNQLQLISRASVLRFKGKHESLPQIAEELRANLVLEGTVVYSGKRARITAQLIDAGSDQHIWANSYERDFDNVITLQDDVAGEVAATVLQRLTGATTDPGIVARHVDPEVRLAYLRGRYFWNKRDEPGLKQAILHFNQAIDKDPKYAAAYAGLADCYNLLSVWGSLPGNEAFPKAKSAAQKALELDPSSSEAYTSLAFETYRNEWDFAGAEKYFQKAIELNPNYATAHQWYGEFLGDLRRFDQSIVESQKAEQLDPLSTIVGSDLADSYLHAGRYRDAVDELEKILAMDAGFVPAHLYLSAAYARAGNALKAEGEKVKYIQLSGDRGALAAMRIAREWSSGERTKARQHVETLLKHPGSGRFDYFQMAQIYLSIGDKDKAFDCLEKAYQEHSWWLVTLLVDPGLSSLQNDPRLHKLARRVGLPIS